MVISTMAMALGLMLSGSVPHQTAPLVPGSKALSEPGRYESPRPYDGTVDFFKRSFKSSGGVRYRHIVNLPGVKAQHIESLRSKTTWEGINIYEVGGKVRYYVIPRSTR